MTTPELTLRQAARLLGVRPRALRQAMRRGTLSARLEETVRGPVYFVAQAEVERYRAAHLGKRGRPRAQDADATPG